MAKAKRLLRENLKLVDAVIEVLDARIPGSSRNPDLRGILAAKPVVAVLTRPDLADTAATSAWQERLQLQYSAVAAVNANSGEGVKYLLRQLEALPKRKKEVPHPLRLIVVGIPNVGKSSLINRLTGRSAAATGDKPGITRGKQWVRVREGLEILDTPGMLWPKIKTARQAFVLAAVGAVKDEIIDSYELGIELVDFLRENVPVKLQERYKIEALDVERAAILEEIGRHRGCLIAGGVVDMEASARLLIKDFREGRLGRITLESAGEWRGDDESGFPEDDGGSNSLPPG
jgi:ribosome biogenesis GTPase A